MWEKHLRNVQANLNEWLLMDASRISDISRNNTRKQCILCGSIYTLEFTALAMAWWENEVHVYCVRARDLFYTRINSFTGEDGNQWGTHHDAVAREYRTMPILGTPSPRGIVHLGRIRAPNRAPFARLYIRAAKWKFPQHLSSTLPRRVYLPR